ncbi:MAG: hypothetical protein WKF84_17155 [Pyrinomonadaceae bacterium]
MRRINSLSITKNQEPLSTSRLAPGRRAAGFGYLWVLSAMLGPGESPLIAAEQQQ